MRFIVLSFLFVACGSAKVEKGEQGLAGPTGPTGASAADSSLVRSTMFCGTGQLATTTMGVAYSLTEFRGGDVFVSGSIYGKSVEAGDSDFFQASQAGAKTGHIQVIFDILGSANVGYWVLESDRTAKTLTVSYDDPDITSQQHQWTLSGTDCTLKTY